MVELDGGGHYLEEQIKADQQRTKELENMNLSVIRICNLDIDRNFRGVCEYIDLIIQGRVISKPSSDEEGGTAQP